MNKLKLHWKSMLWAVVILALLMIKKVPVEPPEFKVPGLDKIVHFGLFFVLSFLIFFEQRSFNRSENWFPVLVVYPALYGGILEIIQWGLIEGRSGDWFDLLADTTGALLVFLITKKGRSRMKPASTSI